MTAAALATAEQVLSQAATQQVQLKALGGIGCWLHANEHGEDARPYLRDYGDVDVVLPGAASAKLAPFMKQIGLNPVESFNVNGGASRRMYIDPETGVQVDVFIGSFSMCHEVPLDACAFAPDGHPSLSATELLLTKLQVVELSDTDANDAASLLAFHDIDSNAESIDGARLAAVLAGDWGLWRTVTQNLGKLRERAERDAFPARSSTVRENVDRLTGQIDGARKSFKWKARAKVGDRVQWYSEPDEPVKEWLPVR
jgi:hypothetical protein